MNIVTTTTAMIMIEKMVPVSNSELVGLLVQQKALTTLLLRDLGPRIDRGEAPESSEAAKLIIIDSKGWSPEQEAAVSLIREHIDNTVTQADSGFQNAMRSLIEIQNRRIERKIGDLRTMGLAGSWSVGILSLLTLAILYFFQQRFKILILNPVAELVRGLQDWTNGNRQRRLRNTDASWEVQESLRGINDLLDENTSRPHKNP